ncbi:hypothetical protein DB346_22955 [Verrucomicrobia bacterium LW23]|nr:hypothetical protein DB346_22955 [Verrucomicrobia bacterium LW23]
MRFALRLLSHVAALRALPAVALALTFALALLCAGDPAAAHAQQSPRPRPSKRPVARPPTVTDALPTQDPAPQDAPEDPAPYAPAPAPRPAQRTDVDDSATAPAPVQNPSAPTGGPRPRLPTTITADTMQMDMSRPEGNAGIFSGNVKVTGTDLSMTCKELRVSFGADNKVSTIVAIGGVDIVQPRRRTQAAQADYDMANSIILLNGNPSVIDPKTSITGTRMRVDRKADTVEVERPTVVMQDGVEMGPAPAAPDNAPLPGETGDPAAPPAKTPTTIVAEAMFMDRPQFYAIFSGAAKLTGKDVTVTCKEMHIFFDKANKPEKVVAIGDVDIVQPGRRIQAGRVDYNLTTKVIILTVRPEVVDPKSTIRGAEITIDQIKNTVEVKNSLVVLDEAVDTSARERPSSGGPAPEPSPTPRRRP